FDAPGQAFDPPLLLELLCRRAERVGCRAEEIELAVAIEIDTRAVELRRHELREAHGAGPGTAHFIALENAVLQNTQRVDQLVAEEIRPASDIGLRCEHADHVMARAMVAESSFASPDGQYDRAIDANLGLDPIEDRLVPLGEFATLARQPHDLLAVDVLL